MCQAPLYGITTRRHFPSDTMHLRHTWVDKVPPGSEQKSCSRHVVEALDSARKWNAPAAELLVMLLPGMHSGHGRTLHDSRNFDQGWVSNTSRHSK